MTTAVVRAYRGALFKDIAQMMLQRGVSALPVIDDGCRVVGVVSEADLLAEQEHRGEKRTWLGRRRDRLPQVKARAVTAEELMTTPAVTVRPETPIPQAARLLERHGIKRMPVVDEQGRLLGVVSRRDLLRVFTRPDEQIRDEILREVFARLLLADPRAVSVQVSHGVVTLTGTLEQKSLVPIAVRLTAATDGVVSVIDKLAHTDDDTTQAARRVPRA